MDTVPNPIVTIYSKWKEYVETMVDNINASMDNSQTTAKMPYANMRLMGTPTESSDLSGNECAITPAIQIDVYTNGNKALSKAYDIDSISHAALVSMRFRRTYGPELIDGTDNSIKRLTSRYSRILGSGDSL